MTTNKRFKLDSEVGFIDTQKCGGDTMTLFEVVVELNKLDEENEQLKSILKEIVRVSEYNGAISPMRVKSMTYNFIRSLK